MSVRSELAALLTGALPTTYRVIPYSTSLDRIEVGATILMIYRATVRPAPTHQAIESEMHLWVLVPRLSPGEADDDLDDALDLVIAALDTLRTGLWTDAERGVWADQYHGYKITVNLRTEKE